MDQETKDMITAIRRRIEKLPDALLVAGKTNDDYDAVIQMREGMSLKTIAKITNGLGGIGQDYAEAFASAPNDIKMLLSLIDVNE